MGAYRIFLNTTLAAGLAIALFSLPAGAQQGPDLDPLYERLGQAGPEEAARIADDIQHILSRTGSPAMDLLLRRGRDSLGRGDLDAAIGHFAALVDHAPGFAEGWHARSVAYARAGLYGPALADLEHALALNPRHFAAIYSLAVLLEEVGQPDLAREAYAQVKSIHPHFEDVSTALDRLDASIGGADL